MHITKQLAPISRFDFHVQLKRIHAKSLDCMHNCRTFMSVIYILHIFQNLNIA